MVAGAVYILGALLSLGCGALLARAYLSGRRHLLLWSAICFFGLALQNFLIFVDLVLLPDVDLYLWRLAVAAGSILVLLFGLIWSGER